MKRLVRWLDNLFNKPMEPLLPGYTAEEGYYEDEDD